MIGRQAIRRCFISLLLLLIGTSLAVAQPFTRRSSQVQHDGLKKTYEIANFRLGGKYDLSDPSKWENGGEGGTTLESLGAGYVSSGWKDFIVYGVLLAWLLIQGGVFLRGRASAAAGGQ